MQTNKGADKKGPWKGVPYDGNNPAYWSLYHPPYPESPRYPDNPPQAWSDEWYNRVMDLILSYQPDLMYFDGGYPFGDGAVGRRLVADYYNANASWHNGRNEAAMCIKKWETGSHHGQFRDGTCVRDVERGGLPDIDPLPWQTDTCIGQWYYRTGIQYKTVTHVVHMLADIVSKNGNLLLNNPLHPEGTIDDEEEAFLQGLGRWMKVNGEAIYGTRPWTHYGEGPTKAGGGHFQEKPVAYTPRDFRFTTKGDTLYAIALVWPTNGVLTIRSLAEGHGPAHVKSVSLLGHPRALHWNRAAEGLTIRLPDRPPCEHAFAFKLEFTGSVQPPARGRNP